MLNRYYKGQLEQSFDFLMCRNFHSDRESITGVFSIPFGAATISSYYFVERTY
jgi:hypothetical protein